MDRIKTAIDLYFQDDLIAYVVPVFLAAVVIEALWSSWKGQSLYRGSDTVASLSMLLAAALFEVLPKIGWIALMILFYEISPFREVVDHHLWAWVLLFFWMTSPTTGSIA